MATAVIMPRQGQSVESCILSQWNKQVGDTVKAGELLFSYETDKASFEEEAKLDGVLLARFYNENDDVPCLETVCVIGNAGEDFAALVPAGAAAAAAPAVVLAADAAPAGETVPASGGSTAAAATSTTASGTGTSASAVANASTMVASAPAISADGTVKISPRARAMASEAGVDPLMATPTGPDGRVIEQDIRKLRDSGVRMMPGLANAGGIAQGTGIGGRVTAADLAAGAAVSGTLTSGAAAAGAWADTAASASGAPSSASAPSFTDVPLTNIRKVIAKAMLNSISTTCQLTLNTSFDATEILAYRAKLKNASNPDVAGITLNDIVAYAVSRTLLSHKSLNAHFLDDKTRFFNEVNLGIAIDTDRGLMVPTVFRADSMSLAAISKAVKAVAKDCQAGSVNPDVLKGGTFTITNLGALGIESFTPVLNAPQTGILGVDCLVDKVRAGKNGVEVYKSMGLSLTFDHRALDGAPAARFLKDLVANLENFGTLLAL